MSRELVEARIYVGGELCGLVGVTKEELKIIGQRFKNAYPNESVTVKVGRTSIQFDNVTVTTPKQPVRKPSVEVQQQAAPVRRARH